MPSHRVLLELTRRYNEPHRAYHNIEHIAWMLDTGRDLALSEEQVLAIWFHDAVYEIGSATNEEDSAALAAQLLGDEGYPEEGIARIERMVLDTKAHQPTIEPAGLVVDLDMAPLSIEWDAFRANTEKIYREYASYPRERIDSGRRQFFVELLARDRIFSTDWGATRESAARANIERGLQLIPGAG